MAIASGHGCSQRVEGGLQSSRAIGVGLGDLFEEQSGQRDAGAERAVRVYGSSAARDRQLCEIAGMLSPQSLSEDDRRQVAAWAADCAERVLALFESEAPGDDRPRDAIARTRGFAAGRLTAADQIRRRFIAGRAAKSAASPAGAAAARAAAQAAGVAHMGAHALGAAAYAARAVRLSAGDPNAVNEELEWQIASMSSDVAAALRSLPPIGSDSAGPLGPGMLSSGELGEHIRQLQTRLHNTTA